ncbi:regulator of microtubule dynamics protein 1-like [Danaus plexippus]|uniref:regulator of microtubule dynamics protein 1-like n=1 Tax=Danaus plexippus TaxID=13037 RepID=UPI002AB21EE1|nr:regulator of microtubule dynamics protein 1-like [Danaus plexippus]
MFSCAMSKKFFQTSIRRFLGMWNHHKYSKMNLMLSRIKTNSEKNKEYVLWTGFFSIWPSSMDNDERAKDKKAVLINSILEVSDNVFETGKYEECYNLLINCENKEDVEIKWRISRVLYNMAKDQKYNQSYRKELTLKAHEVISQELPSHYDHFAVQKWYALTLEAKSKSEGLKQRIEQLETVKKHMDLAVSMNPNDASLLHMLGEWCYQITDLPWHQRKTAETLYAKLPNSTYEDALEYFLRAEEAQPRFYSINLLRLGMCYLKLNMEDQAKYYLKLAASYPAKSNDDHQANKEAAEILKKIK